MLTAAYTPHGSGSATQLVTYAYDAFGNTIQRQAWDGTTATTQRYGLDGWDTAKPRAVGHENFTAWADLDGSNALVDRYLSGPDFGAPTARVLAISWQILLSGGAAAAFVAPVANFFAGDVNSRGGIRVAAKNLDGDGNADLVVGSGTGAGSAVTAYLGKNLADGADTEELAFDAFTGFSGGVFVG
jgi:hypothetical protein